MAPASAVSFERRSTEAVSRRRLAWGIVAAAGLLSAGVFGWRVVRTREIALASVPTRPDASALPAVFTELLADADTGARGYRNSEQNLATLARLYHANGFLNEASRCYSGLMVLEPRNPRWPHLLATIHAGYGRLDEAVPLFLRAVELDPTYFAARLRLGDTLLKTNDLTAATAAYETLIKADSANAYALLGLARCRLEAGDWQAARDLLHKATTKSPDSFGAWTLLATVDEHFGDAASAAAARQRARAIGWFRESPDPWLDELLDDCYDPYRLAVATAANGNPVVAQRRLERAIALAPNAGTYRRQLGRLLYDQHNYEAARTHLAKAVDLNPMDADAWALLIETLETLHDATGAERALAAALARCPDSAALHHLNGKRLRKIQRFDEAQAELALAKKLQPNEARAFIEQALVYFDQDRLDDGIRELQQALKVEPGSILALQILARYAIYQKDESAARHWIQQLRAQPRGANDLDAVLQAFARQFGHAP